MALFPPKPQVPQSAPVPAPTAPTTVALSAEDINRAKKLGSQIRARFAQTLVGQENLRESLITTLVAGGHILIESVPGLAKTTAAQTLATSVSGSFKRVQCTPDLMPSDLVGTQVFDFATQKFSTQIGPIHANFVLLDEINRSNAKTQSAMLEAMAEGATTIGGQRIALPKPFMVIATQNPIETLGTYPLPEAQLDRFLMRISMVSPTKEQERAILQRFMKEEPLETLQSVCTREDILALQKQAKEIYIHPVLLDYMIDLVQATRSWPNIDMGVSPRGSLALVRAVRAYALVRGGAYVVPEDIKTVAVPVLAHRLQLSGSVGSTDAQKKAMTDVLSSVALPTEDWSK